jgi:serine/threonine-protein kinase
MAIGTWKHALRQQAGLAFGALALLASPMGAQVPPTAGHGPYFPADAPWYQDISTAPVDSESTAVINWLAGAGGWGGGRMQIDFSIEVLEADASAPFKSFTPTSDFFPGDCDLAPVPLPANGALEGEAGYQCASDGDCHLIVVHRSSRRLYEMWRADVVGSTFNGGCLAVWNMDMTYPYAGRGQDCSSADAAGFPIAPLLFNADEVAAGHIDHALRFILPNSRMRRRVYVHPATHSTFPTSGPATAPPYGSRLRLRADYPLQTLPNDAARTMARAMQKYGILLADGGTIALTAQSDRFTDAKWSGLLGPLDLRALQVTDFQMMAAGDRFDYTGDCVRTSPLFNDGLELGTLAKWSGRTP